MSELQGNAKSGMSEVRDVGVMGSAGAYYVGARTRPQLIGCALAQELGVLNFGLRVAKWRETNMRRQEGNLIVFWSITN